MGSRVAAFEPWVAAYSRSFAYFAVILPSPLSVPIAASVVNSFPLFRRVNDAPDASAGGKLASVARADR